MQRRSSKDMKQLIEWLIDWAGLNVSTNSTISVIWETVLQVKRPNQQYQSTEEKDMKQNKKTTAPDGREFFESTNASQTLCLRDRDEVSVIHLIAISQTVKLYIMFIVDKHTQTQKNKQTKN